MKKTVKYIALLLLLFSLALGVFTACTETGEGGKKTIICSAFAQYDFTLNILGERAEDFDVKYLLESGSDMHSYSNSVSVSDKMAILSSDLFITVGGSSEKWIDDMLSENEGENVKLLRLIDFVGELVCTGGKGHEAHGHEHADDCDEHIWLSPKRALMMCDAICEEICTLDSENAPLYRENCEKYCEKLSELDKKCEGIFSNENSPYLLFADRFPFVYLTNDYGVSYSAAFSGCSSETGATYETVATLVSVIKEKNIKVLLTLEKGSSDISKTLISEAKRDDITAEKLFSMQNVGKKDMENGFSYLFAMQENLKVFEKAVK